MLRRLLLGIALLLATFGVTGVLRNLQDRVPVVVTATAVPAHTALTREMLTLRQVNRSTLAITAGNAVGRIEDAVGLATRVDLPAGEVVRKDPRLLQVLPQGADPSAPRYQIPEGMRLAGLRLDREGAVIDHLRAGDRVDVIYTSSSQPLGGQYARTILQGVEVFAVADKGGNSPVDVGSNQVDLTLLVTPEQAQALALAKRSGGSVDLSLAPPNPTPVALQPVVAPRETLPAPAAGQNGNEE